MQTIHQNTQPQTIYKKGKMATSRWQLAVRRWLANQQNKPALNDAPLMTAPVSSMLETKPASNEEAQKNTAQKPAGTDNGSATAAIEKPNCHGSMSAMTGRDKFKRCEFCYIPFQYVRDHAKYCSETCSTDAYLCRKTFGDGRASAYIKELST